MLANSIPSFTAEVKKQQPIFAQSPVIESVPPMQTPCVEILVTEPLNEKDDNNIVPDGFFNLKHEIPYDQSRPHSPSTTPPRTSRSTSDLRDFVSSLNSKIESTFPAAFQAAFEEPAKKVAAPPPTPKVSRRVVTPAAPLIGRPRPKASSAAATPTGESAYSNIYEFGESMYEARKKKKTTNKPKVTTYRSSSGNVSSASGGEAESESSSSSEEEDEQQIKVQIRPKGNASAAGSELDLSSVEAALNAFFPTGGATTPQTVPSTPMTPASG